MTFDEALEYSRAYGQRAKRLQRMRVADLFALDTQLLARSGVTRLFGEFSKDELINDILNLEFPDIREADLVRAEHAREQQP